MLPAFPLLLRLETAKPSKQRTWANRAVEVDLGGSHLVSSPLQHMLLPDDPRSQRLDGVPCEDGAFHRAVSA